MKHKTVPNIPNIELRTLRARVASAVMGYARVGVIVSPYVYTWGARAPCVATRGTRARVPVYVPVHVPLFRIYMAIRRSRVFVRSGQMRRDVTENRRAITLDGGRT